MNGTRTNRATGIGAQAGSNSVHTIAATDSELLMRFVRHRDDGAFAEIVARHGGLVWIVCREVLRHHQDIEDAFQATFFILAERAGSIRASESAAAWLFKVAQRTSLAARRKRSLRREEELAADPPVGEEALFVLPDRETMCVLLQELGRLPDHYRTPLALRYLEGQSRRVIAEQTDSTVAQIQGRLVRGRRMLRSRMLRRGVSLSIATGTLAAATATAKAAVTPTVAAATAKTCLALTTGGAATGATATAIQLAKQGAKAMWLASMMKTTAAISTALLAAGVLLAAQAGDADRGTAGNPHSGVPAVALRAAAESDEGTPGQGGVKVSTATPGEPRTMSETPTITVTGSGSHSSLSGTVSRINLSNSLTAQPADVLVNTVQFAGSTEEREKKLNQRIHDLGEMASRKQSEKLELVGRLAKSKTEESLVQRELELTHQTLVQLKLSLENVEGDEARDRQARRVAQLQKNVERLSDILAAAITDSARASTQVEQVDLELSELNKLKSELQRLKVQMELAPPAISGVSGSPWELPIVGHSFDEVGSPTTMTIEARPTTRPLPDALIVRPMRTVRIRVTGTSPDAPIDGVFVVEPMGTVALGPRYGRVKVAGLPILDAEAAIKKELSKTLKDVEVQLTIAEPSAATWTGAPPQDVYATPGIAVPGMPGSAPRAQGAPAEAAGAPSAEAEGAFVRNRLIEISAAAPQQVSRLKKELESWRLKAEAYRLKAQAVQAQINSGRGTAPAGQLRAEALLLESDANHAEAMALEIEQQLQVLVKQDAQSGAVRAEVQALQGKTDEQTERLLDENAALKQQLDEVKARIDDADRTK